MVRSQLFWRSACLRTALNETVPYSGHLRLRDDRVTLIGCFAFIALEEAEHGMEKVSNSGSGCLSGLDRLFADTGS